MLNITRKCITTFFLSPVFFSSFYSHIVSPLFFMLHFCTYRSKRGVLKYLRVSWDRRSSKSPQSGQWLFPFGPGLGGVQSLGPRCATSATASHSWAGGHSSAVVPPSGRGCSQSLPGWLRRTTDWLNPALRHQWWAQSAGNTAKVYLFYKHNS